MKGVVRNAVPYMDMMRFFQIADIKLPLGFDGQLPGIVIRPTWMGIRITHPLFGRWSLRTCSQKGRGNEPEGYK